MNASTLILVSGMLTTPCLAVEHELAAPPSATHSQGIPVQSEPVEQWLDEVRAQRQAREERRRAAKEAMDARRRWIDPWGAAKKEAREKENQRRRAAFRDQIERERDAFRNRSPWHPPQAHWQEYPPGHAQPHPSAPPDPDNRDQAADMPATPAPYPPPLQGWDNRWYYRGY